MVTPCRSFGGTIRPPSDKSLTHRALIFGALAEAGSVSRVDNPLWGEDCQATARILEQVGAATISRSEDMLEITANGQFRSPSEPLDCGNSGTTMRLLAGILAAQPGLEVEMVGDHSLSRRPMRRITEPLTMMGAEIAGDTPPLKISGKNLHGVDYVSPVASAQVKSCILLAGLFADGETWVREPAPSRDHTERMLQGLGYPVDRRSDGAIGTRKSTRWSGFEFDVPADISSAAFWLVAAAILESSVAVGDVGVNPTRTGVLDVLRSAGQTVKLSISADSLGEPAVDLALHSGPIKPFDIRGDLVPRLIDEVPVLAVLASQADGTSRFRDVGELRVKESDRIAAVATGLQRMGAQVTVTDDGFDVTGPTPLIGAEIDADGDHRIAMAFAIAGLAASGETVINGASSIATSYPDFEKHLHELAKFSSDSRD